MAAAAHGYYPPWGFYYKVEFVIPGKGSLPPDDARFQTVSGLSVEYDYESFKEGGENRFEHKLPVRTKYADMVLKRGMLVNSGGRQVAAGGVPRPRIHPGRRQRHPDE